MTKFKIKFNQNYQIFYAILLLIAISFLIIMPNTSINAFSEGIQIWATKVLPALLPFFILTKLLSYTTFVSTFGKKLSPFTQKLYGVKGDSGYVYIMSVISGYPVGAKITSDLYQNNYITKRQACTITSFTSTSGPLFIIGTVAVGLFNNQKLGLVVMIAHIIGALLNGLLYRCRENTKIQNITSNKPTNFLQESMSSSILSITVVGGFIALFYMFLKLILQINLFNPILAFGELIGIDSNIMTGILCGLIEVTTGCIYLSQCQYNKYLISFLLTFLISFGGFSIHAQAYTYLRSFEMPYTKFLLQKTTQAIISGILALVLATFLI